MTRLDPQGGPLQLQIGSMGLNQLTYQALGHESKYVYIYIYVCFGRTATGKTPTSALRPAGGPLSLLFR